MSSLFEKQQSKLSDSKKNINAALLRKKSKWKIKREREREKKRKSEKDDVGVGINRKSRSLVGYTC